MRLGTRRNDAGKMTKAFISYSHRDEKALGRLHTHLATLRREKKITAWYDREILAGDDIDDEISANLEESEIFLALVSPDFLASKYCYEREMAKALERHAKGSLRVVPIILEPCDWKTTPLGKLKALPKDGKAISIWTNENVAYLDVVTELRRISLETPDPDEGHIKANEVAPVSATRETRRYRIKRDFDAIDRDGAGLQGNPRLFPPIGRRDQRNWRSNSRSIRVDERARLFLHGIE